MMQFCVRVHNYHRDFAVVSRQVPFACSVPLGSLQLAMLEPSCQGSDFFQGTLPNNADSFAASGEVFRFATTAREAMHLAYT